MKLKTYFFNLRKTIRARFLKGRKDVDEAMKRRKEEIDDNFNTEREKPRFAGRFPTGTQ